MNKLYIDTNIFYRTNYNFDLRNDLIKALTRQFLKGEFEYCNLSIIDGEIRQDLEEKKAENIIKFKKFKWVRKYVDEKTINSELNKDLIDYDKFLETIKAQKKDVSNINPELIFKKYFNIELPFESNEEKRKEFADAFISEFLNDLKVEEGENIYFVSNDNGLSESITNKKVIKFDTLASFMDYINDFGNARKESIAEYIKANIEALKQQILLNINYEINSIDEEEIDTEDLIISDLRNIEIIDYDKNVFGIYCTIDFKLVGNFKCLDYSNSYWPNDEDDYIYREYIERNELPIEDFDISFSLHYDGENYTEFEFDEPIDIIIEYNLFNN